MKLVPLTKDQYKEWDDFCLGSDDVWFWHTTGWLVYTLNYKPELKSESVSFMINNDGIEGICPLFLETRRFDDEVFKEFSFGGSAAPIPALKNRLSQKTKRKRLKTIFRHIDELALEHDVDRASFRFSTLAPRYLSSKIQLNNHLINFGYLPISLNTQIIDLSKSLKELWGDIRHGHKYDITHGSKEIETEIFNERTATREIFDEYRILHRKAAGQVTRPSITFKLMYDWILQGQALLIGAKIDGQLVGFSYIFTYKDGAYYGSACNDPEYEKKPIGHVLQWGTMRWLKEHGYRYYEVGYQQYHPLPYDLASKKEIAISRFKRGFGGLTIPLFICEKYYSSDYYWQINSERVKRYTKYLKNKGF